MEKPQWDAEGYIIKTWEDGTESRLVGAVGPSVTEKQERLQELKKENEQLEAKLNENRVKQHEIYKWLAIYSQS